MAVVSQETEPDKPRIKISAQTIKQKIFAILLTIAGVDAQPDTLDKGPWYYLMEQYAAEQLVIWNNTANNKIRWVEEGITYFSRIECRRIMDSFNEARTTSASSSSSIPRQLVETALLHIIVRIYNPFEMLLIRLKYLAVAMGPQLATNKRTRSATPPPAC
jgi:hypothetical protein